MTYYIYNAETDEYIGKLHACSIVDAELKSGKELGTCCDVYALTCATIMVDEIHKYLIERRVGEAVVTFYELMGGRWVQLGIEEHWCNIMADELEAEYGK